MRVKIFYCTNEVLTVLCAAYIYLLSLSEEYPARLRGDSNVCGVLFGKIATGLFSQGESLKGAHALICSAD